MRKHRTSRSQRHGKTSEEFAAKFNSITRLVVEEIAVLGICYEVFLMEKATMKYNWKRTAHDDHDDIIADEEEKAFTITEAIENHFASKIRI
ncbi:hypothetical protein DPMN_053897 [Dreissena polymorpha]|uniref:Uncharacterized protein n=1 Tax=Dreissena polymorpha TaxID=45954 RepID=A0A9D4CNJ1_DREPO|nr:hypothetical protein DPMN_053897 [Dreissena polymorpha]